jgi:hypothetical protein
MGTTLTGTTPQDTYDSLIKVTDNGPLTGSLKKLTDGLGNDSSLSLSTGAASIAGTLAVSSTISATSTISVTGADTTGTNVGIVNTSAGGVNYNIFSCGSSGTLAPAGSLAFRDSTIGATRLVISPAGNVGIGTPSPAQRLDIATGALKADRLNSDLTCNDSEGLVYVRTNNISTIDGLRYASRSHRFVSHANSVYATIDADGLKFGSDTAAANALDDYEEGTWTMGVTFGGASVGVTADLSGGTYTKIGRQVTVNGFLRLTNKGSSTGSATLTGLPFTIANNNANFSAASLRLNNITFANQFQGVGNTNTTTIVLQEITEAGVLDDLTNADFANNSQIMVSLTYFV